MLGLNANSRAGDFSDSNADDDRDGYTNLEEYLNWMATPHQESLSGKSVSFDLASYTRGYEKNPSYEVVSIGSGVSANMAGNTLTVTPKSGFSGIAYIGFKVNDAEGSFMTRNVAVKVGQYATGIAFDEMKDKVIISIYPNPATDKLNISTSGDGSLEIQLMNVYGRLVMTETMSTSSNGFCCLDISSLSAGVYLLEVQQGEQCETIKFIKK